MTKYTQDWMPKSDLLVPFYKGIDEFLVELLDNEKLEE